jgi:hypothetical protein
VPVGVVVPLEVVDVEHEHRELLGAALGDVDQHPQRLHELPLVQEAGEAVVIRLLLERPNVPGVAVGDGPEVRDHLEDQLLLLGPDGRIADAEDADQVVAALAVMDQRTREAQAERGVVVLDGAPVGARHVQPVVGGHLDLVLRDPADLPLADPDPGGGHGDFAQPPLVPEEDLLDVRHVLAGGAHEEQEHLPGLEDLLGQIEDVLLDVGGIDVGLVQLARESGEGAGEVGQGPLLAPHLRREAGLLAGEALESRDVVGEALRRPACRRHASPAQEESEDGGDGGRDEDRGPVRRAEHLLHVTLTLGHNPDVRPALAHDEKCNVRSPLTARVVASQEQQKQRDRSGLLVRCAPLVPGDDESLTPG